MNNNRINIGDVRAEKDYKKLVSICAFICDNFEELKCEFKEISDILKNAEICSMIYFEKKFVKGHIKESRTEILSTILNNLESIRKGASEEFTQNIDFVNIHNVILREAENKNKVFTSFIWKCKKVLQYIIYQIDRIKNTDDIRKQVSILKGMIAYY